MCGKPGRVAVEVAFASLIASENDIGRGVVAVFVVFVGVVA